jgi:hypothetical protein
LQQTALHWSQEAPQKLQTPCAKSGQDIANALTEAKTNFPNILQQVGENLFAIAPYLD